MDIVVNPVIPYISALPRIFSVGNGVRVFGSNTDETETRIFRICLQCGDDVNASDVALDIAVNIDDSTATVNSQRSGIWDDMQTISNIPIRNHQKFEILIKCDASLYKIFINARYYCGFPQRIPFDFITHIAIFGDVAVEKICYEEESLAIETPPPTYDEVQARAYATETYENLPLLHPTPGRPPYPSSDTNPLFRPVLNINNQPRPEAYNESSSLQQFTTNIPSTALNYASPNFTPVPKSSNMQLGKGLCVAVFILLIVACSIIFGYHRSKIRK